VRRAKKVGIQKLVFGSGAARNVPQGWDRAKAQQQILEFSRMSAEAAARSGVVMVVEHLNRGECNILNTLAETDRLVGQVESDSFKNLVDCYHLWLEKESLDELKKAMPHIRHVHVSDLEGRRAPGETGKSDFRAFFRVLKDAGYDGLISVESVGFDDIAAMGPRVLAFLKRQWAAA
jgi:sugar phosphate isomerase/epimerase